MHDDSIYRASMASRGNYSLTLKEFYFSVKEFYLTHNHGLTDFLIYPRGATYARVLAVVVCLCVCLSYAGIVLYQNS